MAAKIKPESKPEISDGDALTFLSVQIKKKTKAAMERGAAADNRSVSQYVRNLLERSTDTPDVMADEARGQRAPANGWRGNMVQKSV